MSLSPSEQVWGFPGQVDFLGPQFDLDAIFGEIGALIWAIDAQDEYLEAINRQNNTILNLQLLDCVPNLSLERLGRTNLTHRSKGHDFDTLQSCFLIRIPFQETSLSPSEQLLDRVPNLSLERLVHAPTSHREEKDLLLHFSQQKGGRPKSRENRSPEDILDLGSSESFKNAPINEIFEAGGSCRGLNDDWTTSPDDEDELAMTNMPSDVESPIQTATQKNGIVPANLRWSRVFSLRLHLSRK
jgi:hypothetical protein